MQCYICGVDFEDREPVSYEDGRIVHPYCFTPTKPDPVAHVLAPEWDPNPSKGIFGKRTYFHSLASDDEAVMVYVEHYPERGARLHVSPPGDYWEDRDFLRCATRDDSVEALQTMKDLGDRCYAEWLSGTLSNPEEVAEWLSGATTLTLDPDYR